jgi:peroxiredoxin
VELRGLGAINDELAELGVKLVAISVDPPSESRKVVEASKLPFPILCDEHAEVIGAQGLLHRGGGPGHSDISLPAHLLIDPQRRVRRRFVSRRIQDRLSNEEVLRHVRSVVKSP